MNIRPPKVADTWDACTPEARAWLIAYSNIRTIEEDKDKIFSATGKYK